MKLLFINIRPALHNTSSNMRMKGIIEGAHKNGHICDLLTMEPDEDDYYFDDSYSGYIKRTVRKYYTFKKKKSYDTLSAKRRHFSGTKRIVKKIATYLFHKFSIYDSLSINVSQVKEINIDYNSYDRIISVSDPKSSHKIVLQLIKENKLSNISDKWIQCWGDPWLIDATHELGFKKARVNREEKKVLGLAHRIIYTSPFTLEMQKNIYSEYSSKMIYVNQPSLFVETQAIHEIECDEKITIGYFGDYFKRLRNIEPLCEACEAQRYKLYLVGNNDYQYIDNELIHVYDRQTSDVIRNIESKVKIIVCICNKIGGQIPGKIYYYASMKKPIIVIVDGKYKEWMKVYFKSFNRYIVSDNSKSAIDMAVKQAISELKERKKYVLDDRLTQEHCAKLIIE